MIKTENKHTTQINATLQRSDIHGKIFNRERKQKII